MSANKIPVDGACDAEAYRQACLMTKPRWQTVAVTFSGLTPGILVPGTLFCGWLPGSLYVASIAATLLVIGLLCLGAGWGLMRSSPASRWIDDYVLSGILIITSSALMAHAAAQSGPLQERTIEFLPGFMITAMALIAGAAFMHTRARQRSAALQPHNPKST